MTPRQERFVREYLIDLNATQAAIRAGYAPGSASVTGHDLLRNPKVAPAVTAATRERAAENEITAANVLRGLASIAFNTQATRTEQTRALELLGRHLALFVDRVEHSGAVELRTVDAIDAEIAALAAEMGQAAEPLPA